MGTEMACVGPRPAAGGRRKGEEGEARGEGKGKGEGRH